MAKVRQIKKTLIQNLIGNDPNFTVNKNDDRKIYRQIIDLTISLNAHRSHRAT